MKKIITSVNNPEIKELKKLLKHNSKKDDVFLIEGYHLVEEAMKHNFVLKTYETDKNVKYEQSIIITENVLNALANTKTPEGIIALCKKLNVPKASNKIVFLDNVQDPGNVGTIIRTSKAFGFDTIYSNANFYNDKIIRSTQGALFDASLINYDDAYSALKNLKEQGYVIYATSLEKDSISYLDAKYNEDKIIILVGNEGNGVNPKLYELADYKIYIPIKFESLNVGIATGIILNHIYNEK
ncbi:TrmH family RNA methyltransferase [Mycoplasmopsis adleri]|uniref:TrmH family RNA methyltransferase n=1 Tax=Mycoplasmopsis adleri TaxID=51362 RepID=UPI0038733DB8